MLKSDSLANMKTDMKQARSCSTTLGLGKSYCGTGMVPTTPTTAMQAGAGGGGRKMSVREEVEMKLELGRQKLGRPRLEQQPQEEQRTLGGGGVGGMLLQQR
jgi:hypothetical protein